MLRWVNDSSQVITGLNVTDGPDQHNLYLNMLQGTALALFKQAAGKAAKPTIDLAVAGERDADTHTRVRQAGYLPHLTPDAGNGNHG